MSTITLTIDGRDVEVPAGTGLVEAAAAIDVEIPVFCYEPRLGPPVGACRMCLVEIEGMPKLQAACATGARDGMVVSTVSERARAAQDAVLEFLLVNHPLDCPVCDKGGECPLQDHAFRWGPGESRFGEIKRNNDKPVPVSPLIALDRERCILCYRCTRFSSDVSEDHQLVSRERGANTVIATFEGRPYAAEFSGNVIELCPVGALTSTEFRFTGRPWEITDHASVCTSCPVGCNTYASAREGRVVRVLSRENADVDNGWICDKGRFSYAAMNGDSRLTAAQERPFRERPVGNRPVRALSHELAMEWLHERLAANRSAAGSDLTGAHAAELWVLSGRETLETAWAVQRLTSATGGRVVAAPGASAALPAHPARIADIDRARHVLVIGDEDLVDDAAGLDLRVRAAMRAGATVTVASAGGTRLEQAGAHHEHVEPGALDAWVTSFCERIERAVGPDGVAEPGVVILRDGALSAESLERLARAFSFPRPGSGLVSIPRAANARGLAALGIPAASWDEILGHRGGIVLVGVDPDRAVPVDEWAPAMKRAAWTVCVDSLPAPMHDVADLVVPAASSHEQDGTLVNLEGRLQRTTAAIEPPGDVRTPLSWIAGLARRLGVRVPGHASGAYRLLAADVSGPLPAATHGEIPSTGVVGVTGGLIAEHAPPAALPTATADEVALYVAPFLYDDAAVAHAPRMSFLRSGEQLELSRADAARLGVATGDVVRLTLDDVELEMEASTNRRLPLGHARIHAGVAGLPAGRTGWTRARVIPRVAAAATSAGSEDA